MQKVKDINSFQRYWSSKKPVICLDKSILDYKSWSTIFLDMEFAQENRIPRSFIVYYFQQMIWQNFDENSRKLHFGPILGPFYPWFGRTKIFLDNALMLLIIRLRINSEKTKRFRKKTDYRRTFILGINNFRKNHDFKHDVYPNKCSPKCTPITCRKTVSCK